MADIKLTPKQEKFCQCVASGMSLSDAYIESYDTKTQSKQVIYNHASELAKRDDITNRVRQIRKRLENHAENTVISEIEQSKRYLWAVVHDEKEKTENRLRAVDILNRMNQAYTDTSQQDDTETTIDSLDTDKLIKLVSSA